MIQKIVGISFNPTKDERVGVGSKVKIVHDKTNQYSSRAIAVMFDDIVLGHIGEKNNTKHEEIFNALPLVGKVHTISRLAKGEVFGKFNEGEITHIEVEFPMPSDNAENQKSFNEDVYIKFDVLAHKYTHDGKELLSATRYIKKWIKEFDKEAIAPACANKYGCRTEDVIALWDSAGDVSAIFGTAIHNALEHYEKFKALGEVIQGHKDAEYNNAMPNHPLLRKIVEDFYKLDLQKGEVVSEALLTNIERGLCGFADRILITGEKTCRVQDFKVNIECEKVDSRNKFLGQMAPLPANKLSKYQLQMSFYARLLELSGWKVEGLDAFVFEDVWKHYPLEVLKLDF